MTEGTVSDANVVMFPNQIPGDPSTLEEIQERVDCIREAFCESAAEAIMTCSLQQIGAAGFEVQDLDDAKDMALLQSAIKSLLMKTRGMHHPLQEVAEDMFVVTEDDGYIYVEPRVEARDS